MTLTLGVSSPLRTCRARVREAGAAANGYATGVQTRSPSEAQNNTTRTITAAQLTAKSRPARSKPFLGEGTGKVQTGPQSIRIDPYIGFHSSLRDSVPDAVPCPRNDAPGHRRSRSRGRSRAGFRLRLDQTRLVGAAAYAQGDGEGRSRGRLDLRRQTALRRGLPQRLSAVRHAPQRPRRLASDHRHIDPDGAGRPADPERELLGTAGLATPAHRPARAAVLALEGRTDGPHARRGLLQVALRERGRPGDVPRQADLRTTCDAHRRPARQVRPQRLPRHLPGRCLEADDGHPHAPQDRALLSLDPALLARNGVPRDDHRPQLGLDTRA